MEACNTIWNWVRVTQIPATEEAIDNENDKMNNLRVLCVMAGFSCLVVAVPLAAIMAKVLGLVTVAVTFTLAFAAIILPNIAQNHPTFSQCSNTRLACAFVQCIMFIISFVSSLLFKFPEIYHYVSFGLTLISVNLFLIAIVSPISFGARAFVLGFVVGLASALPHHKWATGTVGLALVLVVFVFGEWVDAKQAEIDRAVQTRQNQQNAAQGAGQGNVAQCGTVAQGAGQGNVAQGGAVAQGAGQENVARGGAVAQGAGQENVAPGGAVAQGAGQENVAQGGAVAQGAGQENVAQGGAVAQGAGQENVAQGGAVGQGAGQENVAQGAGQENVAQGGAVAQGAGQENVAQGGAVAQGAGQENVAQGAGPENVAQGASPEHVAKGAAQENVTGNPQHQAEQGRGDIAEGHGDAASKV